MYSLKENYIYFLSILITFVIFLFFDFWKIYPTYGGKFLQDWLYIIDYSECLRGIKNQSCNELLQFDFVYPEIWLKISLIFQNYFKYLIYPFILFYLFSTKYFFNDNSKFHHYIFLLSPTSILLLQRGNNEIIVYFFLFIFIFFLHRNLKNLSFISLIAAIILKLYPILISPIFLYINKYKKINYIYFLILCITGIFLIPVIIKTQSIIHSNILLTYSSSVVLKIINSIYENNYVIYVYHILTLIFISFFIINLNKKKFLFPKNDKNELSFVIGFLILVPSFFFSSAFDYRFIFIVFTFPYLENFINYNFIKKKIIIYIIIFLALWIEFIIFYFYELIDFNQFKINEGYILNYKTLLFGVLILIKNFFYWIINLFLIFIFLNLIKRKI